MSETNLVLSGVGVPPYSARGLQQTIEPIAQAANIRRSVNGALINLSASQFQKYKTSIKGDDQNPPALDAIWPGLEITIDCIAELSYPIGSTADRTVVPGSVREESGFMIYRPRLTMIITAFNVQTNEWDATTSWSLEAEES